MCIRDRCGTKREREREREREECVCETERERKRNRGERGGGVTLSFPATKIPTVVAVRMSRFWPSVSNLIQG